MDQDLITSNACRRYEAHRWQDLQNSSKVSTLRRWILLKVCTTKETGEISNGIHSAKGNLHKPERLSSQMRKSGLENIVCVLFPSICYTIIFLPFPTFFFPSFFLCFFLSFFLFSPLFPFPLFFSFVLSLLTCLKFSSSPEFV